MRTDKQSHEKSLQFTRMSCMSRDVPDMVADMPMIWIWLASGAASSFVRHTSSTLPLLASDTMCSSSMMMHANSPASNNPK